MTFINLFQAKHRLPITMLDLFSGAGGASLGFQAAGFQIIGAVEIDTNAADTYERNIGIPVIRRDIRELNPADLREKLRLKVGELGVLVGCPPCQGFSAMRNGSGHKDERNELVLRYLKFLQEFRPHFTLFENVPGLIRSCHGKEFYSALKSGIVEMEYGFAERELDAADFGVPQHRRRIIIMAARDGKVPAIPWATHFDPDSALVKEGFRKPWRTVREAIERYAALNESHSAECTVTNHDTAAIGKDVLHFIRQVPKDGGSRRNVPKTNWLRCHLKHHGHSDVYGRLAWDRPANTLTSGCTSPSKGRFVHPEKDRGLTAREAASLQGFPEEFTFCGSQISSQIGNAVPPPLAYAFALSIREQLLSERTIETDYQIGRLCFRSS